jgi:TonB family protein
MTASTPKDVVSSRGAPRLDSSPVSAGMVLAGRYRIEGVAAVGAAGWLLRARDLEVDVDVALKLIAPALVESDTERTRLTAAVRACRSLRHANLVRIYDLGIDADRAFYTMPYLDGLSLRQVMDVRADKGLTFTLAEILPLLAQLVEALTALEPCGALGVLRPTNVMVLSDVLKVTGLPHFEGLRRDRLLANVRAHGGLSYIAPEVRAGGGSSIGTRADVFSLGTILSEMLVGGGGVGEDGAEAAILQAAVGQQLPVSLAEVLARSVAGSPGDRFENVGDLMAALADTVSAAPAEPLVVPKPERSRPATTAPTRVPPRSPGTNESARASGSAAASFGAGGFSAVAVDSGPAAASVRLSLDPETRSSPAASRPWLLPVAIVVAAAMLIGIGVLVLHALRAPAGPAPVVASAATGSVAVAAGEPKSPPMHAPSEPAAAAEPSGEALELGVEGGDGRAEEGRQKNDVSGDNDASGKGRGKRWVLRPSGKRSKPRPGHPGSDTSGRALAASEGGKMPPLPEPSSNGPADAGSLAPAPPPLPPPPVVPDVPAAPVGGTPAVSHTETRPVFVSGPDPEYTAEAERRNIHGDMVISCTITAEGTVRDCHVSKSLPFMDGSVVRALQARKYKPATRDGKPIDLQYTFNLRVGPPR